MASSVALAPGCARERYAPSAANGEILAVAIGLALLALVMCSAHIGGGGFYFDDWSLLALARCGAGAPAGSHCTALR
jgi:hypothetical protein